MRGLVLEPYYSCKGRLVSLGSKTGCLIITLECVNKVKRGKMLS